MSPNQANSQLEFACVEFTLTLSQATELPVYKGSSLRGAFGQALERIGTNFRDYFFNPSVPVHWSSAKQSPPKPYILIPPDTEKTHYLAGDALTVGIVLIGNSISYFMIVFAALQHLGEYMGLGKNRARFQIESIHQLSTAGASLLYQGQHWYGALKTINGQEFFGNDLANPITQLRLIHTTRLRFKVGDKMLRTAPPFSLLIGQLLSRINALGSLYGNGIAIAPEPKQRLLALAETITIGHSNLQWQEWQRYSQHRQTSMPFGGLLGETVYQGELAEFVPWLTLGQWLGVGGKTSFGLGLYKMEKIE